MKPLKIKNLILGEGIPKICVPIVGTSPEEIEAAALALSDVPADVVEWRADWLKGILDSEGKPDIKKPQRFSEISAASWVRPSFFSPSAPFQKEAISPSVLTPTRR